VLAVNPFDHAAAADLARVPHADALLTARDRAL
jgi:hypothetical protein